MTIACQQIDPFLVDCGNLASVKSLQVSLDKIWNNYRESIARYRSLVDENSIEIHEVNSQYASQELRKDNYDQKIKEFIVAAATHLNEQVSRDVANIGTICTLRKQSRFKVKRSRGKASQHEDGGGKSFFNGKANQIEKEKISRD